MKLHHRTLPWLAFALSAALSSCENEEKLERLQDEVRQMGEAQRGNDAQISRLKSEIETLNAAKKLGEEENSELKKSLESIRKEADQIQRDFEAYRQKYKLSMRTRSPGMNLGTLNVVGATYLNVVVKDANDENLNVLHGSGFAKFAWSDLPDELRLQFGVESPGDHKRRDFGFAHTYNSPPTYDEKVAAFDHRMLETQTQIQTLKDQFTEASKINGQLLGQISKAKRLKQDTLELDQSKNLNDAKLNHLKAEILDLSKIQSELIALDPRKRKS